MNVLPPVVEPSFIDEADWTTTARQTQGRRREPRTEADHGSCNPLIPLKFTDYTSISALRIFALNLSVMATAKAFVFPSNLPEI